MYLTHALILYQTSYYNVEYIIKWLAVTKTATTPISAKSINVAVLYRNNLLPICVTCLHECCSKHVAVLVRLYSKPGEL